ncbi:MAG: LytTR family DNA-binding domain-containing protein [Arenimonas sp.]|uniref:LytR/AlgR family response regulator transcription factor n=1 Tax=Arenimonas sp. TaxID=1872635 RepID=UPI0025C713E0|nr:LytTR family DNA-binding domain-containing protein [Arenimonas sp.]MBW8366815.1 LytTR family DNA-binding domain-containing protein [Arenimonas sp.]
MKILIVDDEPLARERMASLLHDLGGCELSGEASNGREAVEKAESLGVDLVLLDVAMPVMDGLEAARHLAGMASPPAVVFCTAFDQHALAAFEAAAVDYLVKPVRPERLAEAIERARRQRLGQQQPAPPVLPAQGSGRRRSHLSARLRGCLRLIPVDDIRYLQAEEKYVVVHHGRGEDLVEESLKSLEAEFGERFIRIHRNCLVAWAEFAELRRSPDGQVHAILRNGGTPLEVSRRCLPQLRERLKHL